MFEVLTPLSKIHRTSRSMNPVTTFFANAGLGATLNLDGSIENITVDAANTITKIVMSKASTDKYESHDVKSGRVSTLENIGVRFACDSECFVGDPDFGDYLAISNKGAGAGKLFEISDPPAGETGDYEIVAIVEEKYAGDGIIVCRTVSPFVMTAGAPSAPTIAVDPIGQNLNVGDLLTLTVTANGTPVLHYQWKKGVANVGVDSSIFTKANVQLADADNYTCVVTNAYGNVTSAVAVVTVVPGGAPGPVLDYYYNNLYNE